MELSGWRMKGSKASGENYPINYLRFLLTAILNPYSFNCSLIGYSLMYVDSNWYRICGPTCQRTAPVL